ncbi:gamma-glutamyl phosphate reductase [Peteryoungia aggregata LMG 23059]|uniref:Gamma-glutamyl phosphate reductase n=1 Tax=Peteryoungia aggregata LMG 23059 TaxID=1368425 RepID=A0ABU0GC27_9HYPH|nr:hypothetical protein [Peteryoungia aggregata]MDQ0422271.1 gamma-glutamyl phosphate reductase [Peteryoungia aggregata LMG 23059]
MTDSTEFKLGEMSGQITALIESVRELARKSDENRSRTYSAIEQLRLENAEIKSEIKELRKALDDETKALRADLLAHEPTIQNINKWRERFNGIVMAVAVMGSIVGAIFGAVFALASKWIAAKLGL